MIVDPSGVSGASIGPYDLCIVGAGPAGISLALELDASGYRICLLDAGGERYDASTQRLFEGETVGEYAATALRDVRLGALGGTSNVWAGWCRPLEALDFEPRPWLPGSGWPFGRDALMPYYRRAHALCSLGELDYDAAAWAARLGHSMLLSDDESIEPAVFFVNPQRFGERYRQRLAASANIEVLLRAPVTRLEAGDASARIDRAAVQTLEGRRFSVHARYFVLAAGGIENARLLLLSADAAGRVPGNAHGLVGRYFTDHPFVDAGSLLIDGQPRRLDGYFPRELPAVPGTAVRAALTLKRSLVERESLLNAGLFFHRRYESHPLFSRREVKAMLEIVNKFRGKAVPGATARHLRVALSAPGAIAAAAVRRVIVRDGPGRVWRMRAMFETESRYENCVTLAREQDALGRARPRVQWSLGERDIASMRRFVVLLDAALRRARIGRVELAFPDEPGAWQRAAEPGKHHLGTTRMSNDPSQGVVDADCRVYDTHNLYVTGGSVFPQGGYANPTLTIVALAVRLGEHLRSVLRR